MTAALHTLPRVWLAGRFLTLHDGTPLAGRHLSAIPSGRWFVDRTAPAPPHPMLGPTPVTAVTDDTGWVALALEAITDSPAVVPSGATWQITDPLRRTYPVEVRADTPVWHMPAPAPGVAPDPRLAALDGAQVIWLDGVLPEADADAGTVQLVELVGPQGLPGTPGPPLAPPVALDYAPSLTIDCALGDHFRIVLAGDLHLTEPVHAPDGHRLFLELIQDPLGGHAVSFAPIFSAGFDIVTVELSPEGGKRDHIGCMFNALDNQWDIVGVVRGY